MEKYLPYIFLLIAFGVPILAFVLPEPTHKLRKKNPILFWFVIVVAVLTVITVTESISGAASDFFKMLVSFTHL